MINHKFDFGSKCESCSEILRGVFYHIKKFYLCTLISELHDRIKKCEVLHSHGPTYSTKCIFIVRSVLISDLID